MRAMKYFTLRFTLAYILVGRFAPIYSRESVAKFHASCTYNFSLGSIYAVWQAIMFTLLNSRTAFIKNSQVLNCCNSTCECKIK